MKVENQEWIIMGICFVVAMSMIGYCVIHRHDPPPLVTFTSTVTKKFVDLNPWTTVVHWNSYYPLIVPRNNGTLFEVNKTYKVSGRYEGTGSFSPTDSIFTVESIEEIK